MTPAIADRVLSVVGDLLITGLVLLAVKAGAVPPVLGDAAIGYLIRAVVIPPLGRSPGAQALIDWLRSRQQQQGAGKP